MIYQSYSSYKRVSKEGYRIITVHEGDETVYLDAPYLLESDEYNVDLSIVVPCYNESKRFPITFNETYAYLKELKQRKKMVVEFVLVNDGSRDAT